MSFTQEVLSHWRRGIPHTLCKIHLCERERENHGGWGGVREGETEGGREGGWGGGGRERNRVSFYPQACIQTYKLLEERRGIS